MSLIDSDIRAGRLVRVSAVPAEVAATAESRSLNHAAATLCRTLDLPHVAMARNLGVTLFHPGDRRQAHLARKAGLKVLSLIQ